MTKITRMYVLSFLFTLHIALSAYVSSTFLTQIIPLKYVGILYTVSYLLTLILLTKSVNILKYLGNRKFVLISLLINMLALVGMITSLDPYIIGSSFMAFTITNTLVIFSIDIFIEHFGNPLTIGRTRGLYLMITNLAWMLCPLITAFLITQEGGYKAIFIISFIATIIMTIGLVFSVRKFEDKSYTKTPFLETYKYLKENHHMLAITMINFIIHFFYAMMVVYMPIYLYEYMHFGWDQIGVIFTIMLAPFVIFNLPIGILIDKYHVKKRTLLYIGIAIISISTFVISYITSTSIALWAFILFMTRMGACIVETTGEIYFFTHTTEEETSLLSVYRDMLPIAYIVAPLVSTLIFIFLPIQYLFAILGTLTLSGLYYIPKLRRTHLPIPKEQTL
ncbi:MFS transporter [Candidatus Nomurabacteria bacterium]|nr:MFS transporter [Candidatus Nomurabacteria bacterium]